MKKVAKLLLRYFLGILLYPPIWAAAPILLNIEKFRDGQLLGVLFINTRMRADLWSDKATVYFGPN